MERIDPGVVALLGGMGGAVLMLLLVLLGVIAVALPMVRAIVRFLGNFDNLSAQRRAGRIVVNGALDDWREAAPELAQEIASGKVMRAVAAEPYSASQVANNSAIPVMIDKGESRTGVAVQPSRTAIDPPRPFPEPPSNVVKEVEIANGSRHRGQSS